ncbi:MAG TPA: ABC transporter permease subunit [Mycobacteriales bacterium]|jgi:ABC-2 type transport system permease protein|nr:ABC transporter permease subunit [Mycobacteriales bacterium]
MSAATTTDIAHPGGGQVLLDVMHSEWTKLRTVRSTYWSAIAAVVISVGLGALICLGNSTGAADRPSDPAGTSLAGMFLAQVAFAIVGVLAMSAEYSTGMIRTTVAAIPQRGYVLAGKAIVLGIAAFVLVTATAFATFFVGQSILSRRHYNIGVGAPGVLRVILGVGLYTTVLVLLALALATILRNTAGTITAVIGIIFVLPIIVALLPSRWQDDIGRYTPANAGAAIISVTQQDHSLGPWAGFGVFCIWAVLATAIAWWTLRHRDV